MTLSETLYCLNKNSGALSVLFSAVVTIATVAYSILTRTLVLETKAVRWIIGRMMIWTPHSPWRSIKCTGNF